MSPTTPFPLYLLPSLPFRRRSSTSTPPTSPSSTPPSSPPQPTGYLSAHTTSHLRCQKCLSDLIPTSSIISKGFTGRHGRAYLVAPPTSSSFFAGANTGWQQGDLPNTFTHKPVPRQLVTGAHTVSDISCRVCGSVLGWKYVHAEEEGQRYKIGKFILETKRIVKGVDGWECREEEGREEEEGVEFDSEDDEECEDLFSGMWTPQLALKRRKNKAFGRRA